MSKKTEICTVDTNNKLFDRNFNYNTPFAPFNENILGDRAFRNMQDDNIEPINDNNNINNTSNRLGNRFMDTIDQWKNANNVFPSDATDSTILNDRKIGSNINMSIKNVEFDKNLTDRIFGINKSSNKLSAENYFRDVSKQNISSRKIGDKLQIANPNKQYVHIVEPNNDLSMKMLTYYQYKKRNSFICSSYSLLSVLILFYIGTSKDTKKELEKALTISSRNNLYNGFIQVYESLQKSKVTNINNCIIINKNIKLKKNYLMLVEKVGTVESADMNYPISVVNKINKWVNKNTKGMIKSILKNDSINNLTKIVLVNTIYFKSLWKVKFKKENTQNKEFYDLVGTKQVKMMHLYKEELSYYENDKCQLLELAYDDNLFVMGIILEKGLNQIIIPPTPETLYAYICSCNSAKVNVQLPKFTQETETRPIDILQMMGAKKMFVKADIEDMTDVDINGMRINNIIQKAKIIVDEEGTEAAAATAIAISYNSVPSNEEPVHNFYADHPFIYYIRHILTNTIIFTGVYK